MYEEKRPMICERRDVVILLYCEEKGDKSYVSHGETLHQRFLSHAPKILEAMVREEIFEVVLTQV